MVLTTVHRRDPHPIPIITNQAIVRAKPHKPSAALYNAKYFAARESLFDREVCKSDIGSLGIQVIWPCCYHQRQQEERRSIYRCSIPEERHGVHLGYQVLFCSEQKTPDLLIRLLAASLMETAVGCRRADGPPPQRSSASSRYGAAAATMTSN